MFLIFLLDSKTLTKEARDNLLSVIEKNNDYIGWAIKIISPTQISNDMLRRSYNILFVNVPGEN